MGFTALITIYLPVGMNGKPQCITLHLLLILDTKSLIENEIYYFLYDLNFKAF